MDRIIRLLGVAIVYNMTQEILFNGITITDIQKILQETIDTINKGKSGSGIVMFDAAYLYNFSISDMDYISKICKLGRYDSKYVLEWHRNLERWYNDQTVLNHFDRQIKPLNIVRNFDKIVNEGLDTAAGALIGKTGRIYKFHALGEGEDLEQALPSDNQLVDEISRIDVTQTSLGGSLTKDGSTVYIVGNHPVSLQSALITETGVFDSMTTTNDKMLDHSIFNPGIDHDQHEDSAGSTTVIYMCGL